MVDSLGHRGFPDAGGGVSGDLPIGRLHHHGNVWRIVPNGGGGLFLRSGNSHPFGGIGAEFFSAIENHRDSRAARVGAFGAGVCRLGDHGVSRRAMVVGLHPDQDIQSLRVVSDRSRSDLAPAGKKLKSISMGESDLGLG